MLQRISKKDKYWRQTALRICGNKDEADDIVQEMYLRLYRSKKKKVSDWYVYKTILSIYLNRKNKINTFVDELPEIMDKREVFEPDDYEQTIIDKAKELPFFQRELLELSFDYSLREIQDMFDINYGYISKKIKEGRIAILGDDYAQKYKNKRLKFRNMMSKNAKTTKKTKAVEKQIKIVVNHNDSRKEKIEKLKQHFRYKLNPNLMTEAQQEEWFNFIKTRKTQYTPEGQMKGALEIQEVEYLCEMYAVVFRRSVWKPSCYSCRGTKLTIIMMLKHIDTVYYNSLTPLKDADSKN